MAETTITHKYNIGDVLWYIPEDNYLQLIIQRGPVKRIVLIKDEDSEKCCYVFGEVENRFNSNYCEEFEVSPDRDSLIDIHIEKRRVAISNHLKEMEDKKNEELQEEIDRIKNFFIKEDEKEQETSEEI
jgi:hypothetical protein